MNMYNRTAMPARFPFLALFCALALTLTLFSCSKEKVAENRLLNDSGVWRVDLVDWLLTHTQGGTVSSDTGQDANAGTITFYDDNTGQYAYTFSGLENAVGFEWSITDGLLQMVSDLPPGPIPESLGGWIAFEGVVDAKKSLRLTGYLRTDDMNYTSRWDQDLQLSQ